MHQADNAARSHTTAGYFSRDAVAGRENVMDAVHHLHAVELSLKTLS